MPAAQASKAADVVSAMRKIRLSTKASLSPRLVFASATRSRFGAHAKEIEGGIFAGGYFPRGVFSQGGIFPGGWITVLREDAKEIEGGIFAGGYFPRGVSLQLLADEVIE
jgi:hypothetical protein